MTGRDSGFGVPCGKTVWGALGRRTISRPAISSFSERSCSTYVRGGPRCHYDRQPTVIHSDFIIQHGGVVRDHMVPS